MNVIGVSALPTIGGMATDNRPHWVAVLDAEDATSLRLQLETKQKAATWHLSSLLPRSGTLPREPFGMLAEAQDPAAGQFTLRRALPTYGPLLLECLGVTEEAGLESAIYTALRQVLDEHGAAATWHDVALAAELHGVKSSLWGTLERGHLWPVTDHQMLALEMMRTLVRVGARARHTEPVAVVLVRGNLADMLDSIPPRSLWSLAMLMSEARRLGVLFVFSTSCATALEEPDVQLLCCYASHIIVSDSKRGALPAWLN